jgi:hypothetical protein
MSCNGNSECSCGCCAGISVQTPQAEINLPGLPAIGYRAGVWSTFRESMLARLSSSDYPALAPLQTRAADDFTIAFLDATSVVLDILTFYQERLANESYLRTAVQLRSLTELSRLIGYQPAPGVSAAAYLAFTLKAAPGTAPNPATPAITIPAETQVQSVPAQGQTPQTFETSAPIQAKADWNALAVETGVPWSPKTGDTSIYLAGTTTQLNPGDPILIVGDERLMQSTASEHWDVRFITSVTPDPINKRTFVQWSKGLGGEGVAPAQVNPKFYALRQRAALFGYNTIDPNMLDATSKHSNLTTLIDTSSSPWTWKNYTLSADIDLDAAYPKIVTGSWVVLMAPGYVSLYLATTVSSVSRSGFGLSAKITRIVPDLAISASGFPTNTLNTAIALGQGVELPVAEQPLDYPLYGTFLDLETLRPDLLGLEAVAVTGKNPKITVNATAPVLTFVPDDGSLSGPLSPGDVLTILNLSPLPLNQDGSIPDWAQQTTPLNLFVLDPSGRSGTVTAALTDFTLTLAGDSDPDVEECALVSSLSTVLKPFPHTRILLQSRLLNFYDRAVTTVNANVGLATNGQSVSEVMGSGSAATPNQNFTLRQSPLTFVQAPTATGRQSTLQVQANAVTWNEVPTLYGQGAAQQVFATLNQSDGTTDVLFGDGVEGATLPTGVNNIVANYRIGSGSAGNVAAGAITSLLDRPIGVSGVNNPQQATGGQDAQSVDGVRASAPQTVLTLGRAVSITDYQNFAATFAGIAKAAAIWIPSGAGRGVFITVAGVGGTALPPGNPTLGYLIAALQNYGNPLIAIHAFTFIETLFGLTADLAYDPACDQPTVEAQVMQTLTTTYSFANRTFGQGVSTDEVAAVIQAVPGVVAVNVTSLSATASSTAGDLASEGATFSLSRYTAWLGQSVSVSRPVPAPGSPPRICAYVPVAISQGLPQAAEILVLDPTPGQVVLGIMS